MDRIIAMLIIVELIKGFVRCAKKKQKRPDVASFIPEDYTIGISDYDKRLTTIRLIRRTYRSQIPINRRRAEDKIKDAHEERSDTGIWTEAVIGISTTASIVRIYTNIYKWEKNPHRII